MLNMLKKHFLILLVLEVIHLALWNIFDIILLDFIWGKVKKIYIYLK